MSSQPATARSILIVEDDELIRRAMQMVLEWEGYEVVCVNNGQEALDFLRSGRCPALIVLDIMMPVLDGQQFREEQLRDPSIASIPVIVVSAASFAEVVHADRHVRKPFEIHELLDAIRAHVAKVNVRPSK